MKHLSLIGSFCLVSFCLSGQDLVTDRPDQTESALTLPTGYFQIETGVGMDWVEVDEVKTRNTTLNTTLLRYGLADAFELRLGWDIQQNKFTRMREEIKVSGLQPLLVGLKAQLYESTNGLPTIALLLHLSLADLASEDFQGNYTAPSFRLSFSHDLGPDLSLGYNLGMEWSDSGNAPATFYTLALGKALSDQLGTYLEIFGNFLPDTRDEHLVNTGLTYLISPELQLDVSFGVGLTKDLLDGFWGAGVSWMIPVKSSSD